MRRLHRISQHFLDDYGIARISIAIIDNNWKWSPRGSDRSFDQVAKNRLSVLAANQSAFNVREWSNFPRHYVEQAKVASNRAKALPGSSSPDSRLWASAAAKSAFSLLVVGSLEHVLERVSATRYRKYVEVWNAVRHVMLRLYRKISHANSSSLHILACKAWLHIFIAPPFASNTCADLHGCALTCLQKRTFQMKTQAQLIFSRRDRPRLIAQIALQAAASEPIPRYRSTSFCIYICTYCICAIHRINKIALVSDLASLKAPAFRNQFNGYSLDRKLDHAIWRKGIVLLQFTRESIVNLYSMDEACLYEWTSASNSRGIQIT
jgi:hypothetical protein